MMTAEKFTASLFLSLIPRIYSFAFTHRDGRMASVVGKIKLKS